MLIQQTAFAKLQVRSHFLPLGNLIYQLDCVSGELRHCSRKTYQELWKKEFLKTANDELLLRKWGELMRRYHASAEFAETTKPSIAGRDEGVRLDVKLRIASFQSKSMDDYFGRLDLVTMPGDRANFEEVVRNLHGRTAN